MMTNNIYYYDKSYDMIHMIIYYYMFYAIFRYCSFLSIRAYFFSKNLFFLKLLLFPKETYRNRKGSILF